MKALDRVSDPGKLQMLLPLIQGRVEATTFNADDELLKYLLSAFDKSAAKELNDESNKSWVSYIHAVEALHSIGSYCAPLPIGY
jgi:hypothetical protein